MIEDSLRKCKARGEKIATGAKRARVIMHGGIKCIRTPLPCLPILISVSLLRYFASDTERIALLTAMSLRFAASLINLLVFSIYGSLLGLEILLYLAVIPEAIYRQGD